MKKILLSSVLFMLLGYQASVNAQTINAGGPASCPIITNFFVSPAGPNNWQIQFDYQNATNGNKWVRVLADCNGSALTVNNNCFDVPKDQQITTHFTSNVITCANLALLTVTVESWVGNNCGGNLCTRQASIGGSPLPVDFKSFSATRSNSSVLLKWQTSTERNSSGFAVERNVSGSWMEVGYVNTLAPGGNSDDILSYTYSDPNNTKGISQYRIREVDLDNRSKYSEIRSVHGEGQPIKIVAYPNPSNDGKVNIAFDEANVIRNISVLDMSGRTVKQFTGVTNNNITIENLMPGIYTVRVAVPETGEQAIQKIIVNKH